MVRIRVYAFLWLPLACVSAANAAVNYRYDGASATRTGAPESQATPPPGNRSVSSFVSLADDYSIAQIATDSAGNTWVAGSLNSTPSHAIAAKLDPLGRTLFTVMLGGAGDDRAAAIAIDGAGNIYLGGTTTSKNFPVRGAVQPVKSGDYYTGFLTKLSADGSQILYSTYFGGTDASSSVTAVIVDSFGSAYVAGSTNAADYPITPGLPGDRASAFLFPVTSGAFFARLPASGDSLVFSGLISGSILACSGGSSCFQAPRTTSATALSLDISGNLYVAGNTNTTDLPATPNAFLAKGLGPFVAKINAAGNNMTGLTYLTAGMLGPTQGIAASTVSSMVTDASGNVYLTGVSGDDTLPVTAGTLQPVRSAPRIGNDAFLLKLASGLDRILWGTYLGGTGSDIGTALSLDPAGTLWLNGRTSSPDFPGVAGGTATADYLIEVNATATAILYAARYSGAAASVACAVAGIPHIAGSMGLVSAVDTGSSAPPHIALVANAASGARPQASPGEIIALYGTGIGPPDSFVASPSAGQYPKTLGGIQVLVNGVAAPLLFASADQVNAVVPFGAAGSTAAVQVSSATRVTLPFTMALVPAVPGVFRAADGHAIILNQDGTFNSSTNRAAHGSIAALWMTGVSGIDPALKDGDVQTHAVQVPCCTVMVDNVAANLLYSGDSPQTIAGGMPGRP